MSLKPKGSLSVERLSGAKPRLDLAPDRCFRRNCRLIFATLAPQSLQLIALPIDFCLVSANLAVLPITLIFLPLELIADQCAGTQAKAAADGRAGGGMSNRRSDDVTDTAATESADTGA